MQIVGYLNSALHEPPTSSAWLAFLQGMKEVGCIEGQNFSFEMQLAEGQYDRLPSLAKSLVDRHVSVIVAADSTSAHAAKTDTSKIPIVFVSGVDPVENGLVASLSHPGANLTGVYIFVAGLSAKRLELLRAVVPNPKLVGVLLNPKNSSFEIQLNEVRAAAREIGQDLLIVNASAEADLDTAFASFVQRRIDGLIIGADPVLALSQDRLATLAARSSIPSIYEGTAGGIVSSGGLMSYGANVNDSLPDWHLHRPDTQGRQARRLACRSADEIRVCHQPKDRESTWPDDSAVCPSVS